MDNAVHFTLTHGTMITIQWSGELRTVIVDTSSGQPILRDLTDAEQQEIEREMAAEEDARWREVPR